MAGSRKQSYNPLLKSYPDSEKINAVSEGAEVLYVRLVAASDDAGRYYGDPKWVLARLFTARMLSAGVTESDIEDRIDELDNVDLIRRYWVDGVCYLQMVDVFKKLRSDVNHDLRFPQPLTEPVPYSARPRNGNVTDTERTRPADETYAIRERPAYVSSTQPNPATDSTQTQPISSSKKFRFDEQDMQTALWMWSLIDALQPNQKEPSFESWANELRLMREQDGRTTPAIRQLFEWANKDTFWSANVLCPKTLRKQWDKLQVKRNRPPPESVRSYGIDEAAISGGSHDRR